ncbi:MAG: ATP-dependent Clp protease ATP-binding subunit [Thermodesulfobacteriota bacterium]
MNRYTPTLDLCWRVAAVEAAHSRYEWIEPNHLFIGLCKLEALNEPAILAEIGLAGPIMGMAEAEIGTLLDLFRRFSLDPKALRRELRGHIGVGQSQEEPKGRIIHRSGKSRAAFAKAEKLGQQAGTGAAGILHLLAALLEDRESEPAAWLAARNLDVTGLKAAALAAHPALQPEQESAVPPRERSVLARFGRDLTRLAREGKIFPAIGRKDVMLQVVRTLSRATKNNPVLVGEAGVGKTAVVEGLAFRIAQGNVPEAVQGKRLIQIQVADLVAGTKYRGEFEERMEELLSEVAAAPEVVLFIDEIHTVVGAGKADGAMDAGNILKPALARRELRCIGATTPAEYNRYIEKDAALERRFQPIQVNEPTPEQAMEILAGIQSRLQAHHHVVIEEGALAAAVNLSVRHLPDRKLPDKAIDLLDEGCARTQNLLLSVAGRATPAQETPGRVTAETVAEVVAEWTGIPANQMKEDEKTRLLGMTEILKERLVGQEEAVEAVAQAVQRARAGLKPAGRPIGVLLFLGPTGVGKTELAKATADFLFGSDQAMLRLDMSEFMERHTVSRLVGSPLGYVGSEEEGQLTGGLRRKPFCVVLLDEIEKAHQDVLNLFLQVFEDGRLTDAKGRRVDASNALFIMTSNLGHGHNIGFGPQDTQADREGLLAEIKTQLRPEFFNRIDRTIIFRRLSPGHLVDIARLMLAELQDRIMERGVQLLFTPALVEWLARQAFHEHNGARPLRRVIEQQVESPLGGRLLRGEIGESHVVTVDVCDDLVTFEVIGTATID